jgi:hypothetical protein
MDAFVDHKVNHPSHTSVINLIVIVERGDERDDDAV